MVTLAAVGDIILAGEIERRIPSGAGDFVFEKVRPLLAEADITFGNLECPLSDSGEPADQRKEFTLRASPGWAGVLKRAGFDVLCLANNHIFDYGPLAMHDTLRNLEQHGISHVGVGGGLDEACKPWIRKIKEVKIALLAFTYSNSARRNRQGCCPRDLEFVRNQIKAVKESVDFVIVSIHDGLEYVDYPSREIMTWFRSAADAGANLVLGHHPHVVQGVEVYNSALLCYSLGNFVSDYSDEGVRRQSYARTALAYFGSHPLDVSDLRTTEAFVLRCELAPGEILGYSLTPVRTNERFQVEAMSRHEAETFLKRVEQLSERTAQPDEQVLDEIDGLLEKCRVLSLKRLAFRDVLAGAHRLRPRHLKMLIPFLKAKLS